MNIKNIILKKNILDNKHFTVVTNIVSTFILVFAIVICLYVVLTTKATVGVPNIGGYSFLSVKSSSMDPTFKAGDLIVIKRYENDGHHKYAEDDVITFITTKEGDTIVNTHRIIGINKDGTYITKGDAEEKPDKKPVKFNKILGVYTGARVPKLGRFVDYAQTPAGVMLMIILPAALIVIWQIFNFLRNLAIGKQVVNATANSSSTPTPASVPPRYYPPAAESEKEAIIQEYLQKQQEEEFKKQQIIEEYLAKQKELEEAEKAKAEEAKIKAIISEFLAQQKAAEQSEKSESTDEKTEVQAESPDSADDNSNS